MPLLQEQITAFTQKAKAAGYTDEQIQAEIARKQQELAQQEKTTTPSPTLTMATPTKPATPQEEENIFKRGIVGAVTQQLPVIGGTLGMLGGGALGIESGPGALATAAVGGGAGSAAGEALRQKLTTEPPDIKRLVGEGALGALAAPVGAIGGRIVGGVAKRILSKTVGEALGEQAGRLSQPVKEWLGQFAANRTDIKGMDLVKTATKMINNGFKDAAPEQLQTVVDSVTGADGVISKLTREAVGKIKGEIPLAEAYTAAKNILSQSTIEPKKINTVLRIISRITPVGKGPGTMNPLDTFDALKTLEKKAQQYLVGNTIEDKQIGQAFRAAADTMMDTIERVAKNQNVLEGLKTPDVLEQLGQISGRVAQDFQGAKTIADIRSIAAPFVNTGRLLEATTKSEVGQLMKMTRTATDISKLNVGNWPALIAKGTLEKITPILKRAASGLPPPEELLQSPVGKMAGALASQAVSRSSLIQNIVGLKTPDFAAETGQLPELPLGIEARYSAKNYMADLDRLQGMAIDDKQKTAIRTYLKERYNASQGEIKGIIASHKLTSNEKQFMDEAPMLMDMINRLRAQIKATPPDAAYLIPGVAGATAYLNPKFAGMLANMTLHQGTTDRIMVGGRLSGYLVDLFKASVPQPGDSPGAAVNKLDQYEMNLINKYQEIAKDYALSQQSTSLVPTEATLPE